MNSPADPIIAIIGERYAKILGMMRAVQSESLERGAAEVAGDVAGGRR